VHSNAGISDHIYTQKVYTKYTQELSQASIPCGQQHANYHVIDHSTIGAMCGLLSMQHIIDNMHSAYHTLGTHTILKQMHTVHIHAAQLIQHTMC